MTDDDFRTRLNEMPLAQRVLVGAGFVVAAVTAIYMLTTARDLPEQIPMQYDGNGAVLWYAERAGFWMVVLALWFVVGGVLLAFSPRSLAVAFTFFWLNVVIFGMYDLTYHQATGGGIVGLTPGVFVVLVMPGAIVSVVLAIREKSRPRPELAP